MVSTTKAACGCLTFALLAVVTVVLNAEPKKDPRRLPGNTMGGAESGDSDADAGVVVVVVATTLPLMEPRRPGHFGALDCTF